MKGSWLHTRSTSGFPELLATDPVLAHDVDVFVFEYFTPKFGLAPSIIDLDDQLRGALDDHQVFTRHKKVVFLAHSMGGVVVRQYLLGNPDRILPVPIIYIYATPCRASPKLHSHRCGHHNSGWKWGKLETTEVGQICPSQVGRNITIKPLTEQKKEAHRNLGDAA